MHVLATELATLEEADAAVDLGQSPADIVVLSFSDSDLSALAAAWRQDADVVRERGILFAALPGDDRADPRLASVSTLAAGPLATLDRFFREGGLENLRQALRYAGTLLGRDLAWTPPAPVGPVSVLGQVEQGRPVALIVFYRANLM